MLMAKPACGARKPIKNQEGQGMLKTICLKT